MREVTATSLAADLYDQHHRRLLRIARRNLANAQDAEEILHDAFIAFVRHFDPQCDSPPLAWLTLTLKRMCWAMARREGHASHPLPGITPLEIVPTAHSNVGDRLAERDEAERFLATLKEDERNALGLQAAGLSYKEIAALKEWTYTKVNRCITEGRDALRVQGACA